MQCSVVVWSAPGATGKRGMSWKKTILVTEAQLYRPWSVPEDGGLVSLLHLVVLVDAHAKKIETLDRVGTWDQRKAIGDSTSAELTCKWWLTSRNPMYPPPYSCVSRAESGSALCSFLNVASGMLAYFTIDLDVSHMS